MGRWPDLVNNELSRIKENQIEKAENVILAHPCRFIPIPLNPRHLGSTATMGSEITENRRARLFLHPLDGVAIFFV